MGFVDKFKSVFSTAEDYDDDDMLETTDYYSRSESRTDRDYYEDYSPTQRQRSRYDDDVSKDYSSPATRRTEEKHRDGKVLSIHATTQLQVVLVKPEKFDDASNIADHLNSKRTIVLNLESCNREISRRLLDFLSGVAYANNGQIKRAANSTFIITPYNVDIKSEFLMDEIESSGVYL